MGRGLFVTRSLKSGELLLAEMAAVNTSSGDIRGDEWSGRGGLLGYYDWSEKDSLLQLEVAATQLFNMSKEDDGQTSTATKLSWLYREGSTTQQQTPDIRWYLPTWHVSHQKAPAKDNSLNGSCSGIDVDTVRAILKGNQFGTETVTDASAFVRESLIRTIQFLCDEMAFVRGEEQTLRPVTALQSMIVYRSENTDSLDNASSILSLQQAVQDAVTSGTIDTVDHLGCTALHYAVMLGDVLAVQELASVSKLNVSALDRLGFSALHYAASQYFDMSILRILLSHECIDVNVTTLQWQTPLALACGSRQMDAVRMLLDHGANPTLGHPYPLLSACPLDEAIEARDMELLRLFAAAGYNPLERIASQRCRRIGLGLWLVASFCNHAESPNTVRVQIGDLMLVYAGRDLGVGEEVFICYSRDRELLKEKWLVGV